MAVLLKKGDQGLEVSEVQTLLMERCYLTDEEIDGVFGNETYRAVRVFQSQNLDQQGPGGGCIECDKKDHSLQGDTINRGESGINGSLSRIPAIQWKLRIGASDDPLEQEADRIANQVLAALPSSTISSVPSRIQRFTAQPAGQTDTVPVSVGRALASSSRPMGSGLRADMEQRFGHDFSRVRVHSGTVAEQSAREVSANAYTVGHNIVFGAGRFLPETHEGRRLIVHELTHMVQQSGLVEIGLEQGD